MLKKVLLNSLFIFFQIGAIAQGINLIDKLKKNKVSILEINVFDGAQIVSKEEYLTATYTLYTYKDGLYSNLSDTTEIKGRGNSTWNWPKKPFRLKLKNSKSLLSMPANKHWALLANFADKTLSRNKIAMELGGYWGLPNSPRSEVIELVVNGWHWGSYQLIEVPKIATDRVNISSINSKSGTPNGGVIFELDARLGEQYYFYSNQQLPITIKDPDDLNTTNPAIANQHLNYVSNIFKNAEDVLFSSNFTDSNSGYSKFIDTSSVYNWYLTQEVFKNIDLSRYSVFFYLDTKNNNKITFGPLWDFDMSSGVIEDPIGIRGTENLWISRLYDDPSFINAIKSKWQNKRSNLLQFLTSKINENARKLHFSQQTNFNFWNQFYSVISNEYTSFHQEKTYEDDVFYLKKWMNQRVFWLDQQFSNIPISFIPVTKDFYENTREDTDIKGQLEAFQSIEHVGIYKIIQNPKHGNIQLNDSLGNYTYSPHLNFNGIDSALYIYNDGINNSDTGLIHFTIDPLNDLPVTRNASFEILEDQILEKDVNEGLALYASDVEFDKLNFELIQLVKHGTMNLNSDGSFKYIPDKNYFGTDTFYFKAIEKNGISNISFISINITPINDTPIVNNMVFELNEDELLNTAILNKDNLLANDVDQDSLVYYTIIEPNHGRIEWLYNGNFIYKPDTNYSGIDSLTFRVFDNQLYSKNAILKFNILSINDAPIAYEFKFFLNEDEPFVLNNLYKNFSIAEDIDLDSLRYYTTNNTKHGQLEWLEGGNFKYTPDLNYFGTDSISYIVKDDVLYSDTSLIIFNILPVNDPPTVKKDTYFFQIKNGEQKYFNANMEIFEDIEDIDDDKFNLKVVFEKFANTKGDIVKDLNGTFYYTPNATATGIDSIKFIVSDTKNNFKEIPIIFRILKDNLSIDSYNISLYPNPTSSNFKLRVLNVDQIIIQDLNGIKYSNIPFYKSGEDIIINCTSLPSGNYIIQLFYNNKLFGIKKFIKL